MKDNVNDVNDVNVQAAGAAPAWVMGGVALMLMLLSLLMPASVLADEGQGVAQLRAFVARVSQAEGVFEQTVHAASGRRPQFASGHFVFQRPGRFRWVYEAPYPQVLVSDGQRLWSWDEDLNQVTVQTLGDALGSTPAAVIAGNGDLDADFELADAGERDGLMWVEARPRLPDSMFESVRLGLSGGLLRRMEMRDNFGQRTEVVFSELHPGADIAPDSFSFTPPPGADIIGE